MKPTKETPKRPNWAYELKCGGIVCGVDEAGRGPLAGPVVAAAVVFENRKKIPRGIHDSKLLTREIRETLFKRMEDSGVHTGVGIASVAEIDSINILQATLLAMARAVEALPVKPDAALIDGNQLPKLTCKMHKVVKGDSLCLSIAAASIIAKVTRDRIMCELAQHFPQYGFDRHVGYNTPAHQRALVEHGPCVHHRTSFAPVRNYLQMNLLDLCDQEKHCA